MPVIGFLNSATPGQWAPFVNAFRLGLKESGYKEGENVTIEARWAEGQNNRLPTLAADLISRQVTVLIVSGGTPPVLAAKAATTTIPIVFMTGDDPVEAGFVAALDRPGGNMTGVTIFRVALGPEPLSLLRELMPKEAPIGVLISPINPGSETHGQNIENAARAVGQRLLFARTRAESELEGAVASLIQQGAYALIVTVSPFFISQRDQLVALAARHAIPAIYPIRGFVEAGGLMSYGANLVDAYRELGIQTALILKGARPAEVPVRQAMKSDLVINRKTANALGLNIPATLLARANKVIE
jgi:putative ABC transport system substrate-binding protein